MENSEEHFFTVGELASKAGVSVRTLQYYDKIGLLNSTLSEGGRRMYARYDIMKLQQILFLKSFGFSLEEIKDKILNHQTSSELGQIFIQQREILLRQIGNLNRIVTMLDTVIAETKSRKEISLDKLTTIMELMKQGNQYTFMVKYFGDEQLENIGKRFNSPEKYQKYMIHEEELFVQMDSLYRKGADPAGKEGQELAAQWWNMVNEFTAGDYSLLKTLFSAGRDTSNWPEETKEFQNAIENFLGKALSIYLHNNGIKLPEMEVGKND